MSIALDTLCSKVITSCVGPRRHNNYSVCCSKQWGVEEVWDVVSVLEEVWGVVSVVNLNISGQEVVREKPAHPSTPRVVCCLDIGASCALVRVLHSPSLMTDA